MNKRIVCLALCLAFLFGILPFGPLTVSVAAEDYSAYKTENVVVPEGWDYVEVSTLKELLATCERHGEYWWRNDGQPMFVRLMDDIEAKDRWVSRFSQACVFLDYCSTTVIDFNGHRINCEISASKNGDNHTWYGVQVELNFGVCHDFYFRLVDSVGGGGVFLDAFTDVDGPTTALMINGDCIYGYPSDATEQQVPYWKEGVRVYIDGGRYYMYSKNEKFCGVQGGPLNDSSGFSRWGYSLTNVPYARSAVALDCVFATINKGRFCAIYPTNLDSTKDDMGRRFMSDLGLCDNQSASFLRINGGSFGGTCYSVYTYGNMSIYADEEKWMKKLDPMPVINGGEFHGGIQFCSTRTSFWRKLQGAYDLNPKMKDVKISEILHPGAKVYMDGKLVDVNSKDLEDIAWPHDVIIEPGPQIIETRLVDAALPLNGYTGYLVHYDRTPDEGTAKLEEYVTVIRPQGTVSHWAESEGSYYTLQTALGENWYNYHIAKKTTAGKRLFRAVAEFEGTKIYSDEFTVEWVDDSKLGFTYGPVVHDGNGEGVAYVEFDVSSHHLVKKVSLSWLDHGEYWSEIPNAPSLTPAYNNGLYRFYIPELADKNSDQTEYHVTVEYNLSGVMISRDSESFVITEEILGAPMDPYDVELSDYEFVLGVGESKTVYVTLFPTAAPHKEGFNVEYTNPGAIQIDSYNTAEGFFTFTAKAEGTCTVKVTAQGGAYAELEVTVVGDADPILNKADFNRDGKVDSADAIYLLRAVLFPLDYPITLATPFYGEGEPTSADAIYLLRHVLFPDDYPIE